MPAQKIKPGRFGLFDRSSLAAYLAKHHPVESENSPEIKFDPVTELFKLTEAPASSAAIKRRVGTIGKPAGTSRRGGTNGIAGDFVRGIMKRYTDSASDGSKNGSHR